MALEGLLDLLLLNHVQRGFNTSTAVHGLMLATTGNLGNVSEAGKLVVLANDGYLPEAAVRPGTASERGIVRAVGTPASAGQPTAPILQTGNVVDGAYVPLTAVKGPILSRDTTANHGLRLLSLDNRAMGDVVFVSSGNGVGKIQSFALKDGATVLKTVTFTYDSSHRVATMVEVEGGVTLTSTYTYDSSNRCTGIAVA